MFHVLCVFWCATGISSRADYYHLYLNLMYLLELSIRFLSKHDGLLQFFLQLNDTFFIVNISVFQDFTASITCDTTRE